MEQKGFFCYNSWLKALEPYGDAEKGRIWTTLLEYSNGLAIDGHSSGNERFILPMLLDQIDRDAEKREQFAEKQRENGKKGGRPPKPKETQQNPEKPKQTTLSKMQQDEAKPSKSQQKLPFATRCQSLIFPIVPGFIGHLLSCINQQSTTNQHSNQHTNNTQFSA